MQGDHYTIFYKNNGNHSEDNIDLDEIDELAQNQTPNFLQHNNSYRRIEKPRSTKLAENQVLHNNIDDDDGELTLPITMNDEPNTFKQANSRSDREK
ncbi:hypothetical protein EPUL_002115 [Erysiphe pulchra]|uniref:Uncharacterized protein n=1 Tax=Erysiphe pulchra TaxID=225359 RepID=A0A2S4PZQ6_9PEZI|nr:hypothetical protein EPUL_002115 [Erysiphe pulchra]